MNYLNFFPTREQPYEEPVLQFEVESGHKLPPLYKVFIENYVIEAIRLPAYLNRSDNMFIGFFWSEFLLNESVGLYKLLPLKAILPSMKAIYPPKDPIWKRNLIKIADCAFQMSLMVGVGRRNQDQIFIESISEDKRIMYVCDNIFTFFRNHKVTIALEMLPSRTLSGLYKNWGEDFWRIHETENPPQTDSITVP